ncbi:protein phosphatase 1 regulatory subunit 27 [Denticeps clupeoides]|uniref:protein phosphatase 1 regulatory subunit 27 n=1 Tax=Denticeps clupeoides TaxID=299321 RepID=UPI0010A2EA9A|nr:protein phosphatase 1 regulatory subunit 27-like [Denticeps clupeoides]
MKYNSYQYSLSSIPNTRYSSYTPTHNMPSTHYTSSHYTPTQYTSTKYNSSLYTSTQYTPTYSALAHKSTSTYIPSYSKSTRGSTTRQTPEQKVVPPITLKPARAVHFPNDIVFQDHIRRGDLEQIGRFMRARKVRLDKLFLSGMAALHEAVLSGNLECVKLLVTYGADVHQRDEDGWTPLHMACSDGFPEIAQYLLSMGSSTEAENGNGEKPADLIDPDCNELVKLFAVGCV